ncbi:hypothetical protein T4A_9753 [Trichinella pseudospiralis]|uniref:Uncharacterized protein n=1 Tax=Trichinella pseudospiralis TaxID=6337 RepID=A0A0V1DLV5_TRIPS|nr:hypothetical protein T4A_9753 [Trichinella pseudospiralis]
MASYLFCYIFHFKVITLVVFDFSYFGWISGKYCICGMRLCMFCFEILQRCGANRIRLYLTFHVLIIVAWFR